MSVFKRVTRFNKYQDIFNDVQLAYIKQKIYINR